MEKVLKHEHRSKKEGVTLVEAVIAIAVVVTVSVSAATLATTASNSIHNTSVKRFFRNEIDTISGLYLTYDLDDFSKSIKDFCGIDESFAAGNTYHFYYGTGYSRGAPADKYEYKLDLEFAASKLTLTSTYQNGDAIYSREVSK